MSDSAPSPSLVAWTHPAREAAFHEWLARVAPAHALDPASVRLASADASFRRYLRVDGAHGSRIVMDAPPEREDCAPFVKIAALMAAAGLNVPRVLEWDAPRGFMLLDDLGTQTMIEAVQPEAPAANQPLYLRAIDALIAWQRASRPGVLPAYDEALLTRELSLFPDWYLQKHRGIEISAAMRETLDAQFRLIVQRNLASPSVYVHRDFMPRNLMMPRDPAEPRLGVLDFQDAVYGPVTYDIACLMRDAFLSWDEEFVLDITVRYWQRAVKAGLPVDPDFGEFYRAVEWMGLQRHLKVAGIFARLTLRDGKPKYLADAPRFIGYIRATVHRYRELAPLARLIDAVEGNDAVSGYAFGGSEAVPRIHCGDALGPGLQLALPAGAARHVQVLRLQPGDGVTLFDGRGGEYEALIEHMGRSEVRVQVGAHRAIERETARAVHLAVGMPANERMDWLVEKATELGVASLQPLVAERSVLRLYGERAQKKQAHWQGVAIAACEQCGRNRVPVVHAIHALPAWLARQPQAGLVLSLRAGSKALAAAGAAQGVTLLSGPEGGLAPAEEDAALARGWQAVHLGERVLRAETAPLAALAVLTLAA